MGVSDRVRRYAGIKTEPRHDILETETAICDELDEIERRRGEAGIKCSPSNNPCGENLNERAGRLGLTALCLSGGGIRSAAFCLGVLQSLAQKGRLNDFDYLSTVSGGGFIGGWLQMFLRRAGDISDAQRRLGASDVEALNRLRGFTNYLTPKSGPFSSDVWAGIVLYLRNLLLNWLIFAPLFLLLALAPISYRTVLAAVRDMDGSGRDITGVAFATLLADLEALDSPTSVMVVLATVALAFSAWQACRLVPSHRPIPPGFVQKCTIVTHVLLPSMVWSFIAPAVINRQIMHAGLTIWIIPGSYGVALLLGYIAAWLTPLHQNHEGCALYKRNAFRWFFATCCSTGLIALAIYLIEPGGMLYKLASFSVLGQTGPWVVSRETALSTFGPLWFIGTHVFHTTFYVGFRKEALLADLDREWLARLNGIVLMIGTAWTIFALSCLILPALLPFLGSDGSSLAIAGTGTGASILGAVGAWLGKKLASQLDTVLVKGSVWTRWVPNLLAVLFGIGVFVCASSILQPGLGNLAAWWNPDPGIWHVVLWTQLLGAGVLGFMVVWFGRVNVNRFSMHAIYRNRLARAFLGSARNHRTPDPFTGFDEGDNPPIAALRNVRTGQRLFPVVNMTLNVTSSSNAAWAERKAESFFATPLAVGAAMLRHPSQRTDGTPPIGAFVRTRQYAGKESRGDTRGTDLGPRLGSLLTISGAAVSPNWGYHSSPLTAFLMTLFNVRLGAWLPNPAIATPDELLLAKPKNSALALIREMLGATTDTSQAVYLSDGGHFENLGIYEMLRRRCKRIVVIDAGQDQGCAFFDLGNAIRKARIDLNAEVTMPAMRIMSRQAIADAKDGAPAALAIAVGTVTYREGGTGKILYLKPSFLASLPADVLAYGRTNTDFPHDNTADQWFTESQFESYRKLGNWHLEQLEAASLEGLFNAADIAIAGDGPGRGRDAADWSMAQSAIA